MPLYSVSRVGSAPRAAAPAAAPATARKSRRCMVGLLWLSGTDLSDSVRCGHTSRNAPTPVRGGGVTEHASNLVIRGLACETQHVGLAALDRGQQSALAVGLELHRRA